MSQFTVFRCHWCGRHLLEAKGRKLRSDKRFCSTSCRMAAKRHRDKVARDVLRVSQLMHDAVELYYTSETDQGVKDDCQQYMIGLAKSLKFELANMGVDMTYSIRYAKEGKG